MAQNRILEICIRSEVINCFGKSNPGLTNVENHCIGLFCIVLHPIQGRMPASWQQLRQLAIFFTVVSSTGCATMYYMIQKSFSKKEYFTGAIEKLESKPSALEIIGAPPLKVHTLRLMDKYNHVDKSTAQIKIPVSGSLLAGNLCSSAVRDHLNQRWDLQDVVLELDNGQSIPIYHSNIPPADLIETSPVPS
ncbi:cytochrome c oxidase assembly factor 1 homolog isoform X2 [Aquarana catesbeiana]|uniref:cytochrome c oxidase assembly factor 1 homolog isoform X2 n=1 Tax=Aquarana catesbeiana TaxID=8400 RepID=UPI003CC990BB